MRRKKNYFWMIPTVLIAGLLVGLALSFSSVAAVGEEAEMNTISQWSASGFKLVTVPVAEEGAGLDQGILEGSISPLDAGCTWDSGVLDTLGAISYWPLNESAGATTFNDTEGNHDGTCNSETCPTAVTGASGNGRFFIAEDDDFISVSAAEAEAYDWTIAEDFSISAWVKVSQSCSGNKVFLGRYQNGTGNGTWWIGCVPALGDPNAGLAAFHLRDSDELSVRVTGTTPINDGRWHYIVGVRDYVDETAEEIRIYVDGTLQATESTLGDYTGTFDGNGEVTMGSYHLTQPGEGYFLNGGFDEATIFGSALDATAIADYLSTCTFDPVVGDVQFETEQNLALEITSAELYANSDPNGGSLSIDSVAASSDKGGTITGTAPDGPFTFTPATDFVGTDIFTFVVSDGTNTDQGTAIITVLSLDVPEIENPGDQTNNEGDEVSLQIVATDPNEDVLTYSATGLPADLSIDPDTGLISGTVAYTASGDSPYAVTVTVTDPDENTASAEFNWTINRFNLPPEVENPGDQADMEGDVVSLQIVATDPNEDPLEYQGSNLPDGLSIDTSTGLISGTIAAGASDFSPYTVTVAVDDGEADPVEVTFTWTVSFENLPPQITTPDDQTNTEGDTVSLQIQASDPDGDELVYSATGLPQGLSINESTGLISGTIAAGESTFSPFIVTVSVDDLVADPVQTMFKWYVNSLEYFTYLPIVTK